MLALGRFWSAWPLHPLTSRSSSCLRMAGACSAKVLVATADRRVISRPRECGNQQPRRVISSSLQWCTRCMQVARISRPQVLRCRPQQPCISLVRLGSQAPTSLVCLEHQASQQSECSRWR